MAKTCNVCNILKDNEYFYKNILSKDGFRNNCKQCEKKRKKIYYSKPEIKAKEKEKKNKYRNIEKNKIIARKKTNEWYHNNKNKVKKYQKENAYKLLANNAKYRAKKLNATPKWLTKEHLKEIREIYKNSSKDHHVDHIVPLQGKSVSGLHVPWNLRVITKEENLSKSNKLLKEAING